jgi:uncharacterized protein (DUF1330 family)
MSEATRKSGRGYIYIEMTIRNPEVFGQYTALSAPAVQTAGGRYIVLGARPECLEGAFNAQSVVIVEFDTVERARAFYHSAEYQAVREKRLPAADFKMLLMSGVA